MEIKVGMELTIRSGLRTDMDFCLHVSKDMVDLAGKKAKVIKTLYKNIFYIDLDKGLHKWSLNMFEEFNEILNDIICKHERWLNSKEDGKCASLVGMDLRYASLANRDLRYINLNSTILNHSDLRGADLRNTSLKYADLHNSDLSLADLSFSDLTSANLHSAYLCKTNLGNSILCNVDLCESQLHNANFSNTDLSFTDLYNAVLYDNNKEEIKIKGIVSISPIGSRKDETKIIITVDDNILIKCGCFYNYIDEFEKKVHETHKNNHYEKEYMAVIELAKSMIREK